jgi:predicted GTPase
VVIINKVDTAKPDDIETVRKNVKRVNPRAQIVDAASPVTVEDPEKIRGKRVLVVEDGPTLTHGGMGFGAGVVAARQFGAKEFVDPRPFAVGSLIDTLETFRHREPLLPAMGYSEKQIRELEATIDKSDAEVVVIGTPIDLRRVLKINKPAVRVRYELKQEAGPDLGDIVRSKFVRK